MSKTGHTKVGHPVDVACGDFMTKKLDANIVGCFPILFIREYNTAYLKRPSSILGYGWHCCYDIRLKIDVDGYTFTSYDGTDTIFDDLESTVESGGTVINLEDFAEIKKSGKNLIVTLWGPNEPSIRKFVFFEKGGPVQRILDSTGRGLELIYRDGKISIIRQIREERELRLQYNQNGLLLKLTVNIDEYERQVASYGYDPEGRLAVVYDSLGNPEHYEYDNLNRMISEIRRDGAIYHFRYDSSGRCVQTVANDNFDLKILDYRPKDRATVVTNSLGGSQTHEYNEAGQVVSQTSSLGYTISSTVYDGYGRISQQIDGIGGTWKTEYDEQGNKSVIINPAGYTTQIEYNENHLPIKITYNSQIWYFEYDDSGRIVQTINPLGFQWKYAYNERGDLLSIHNPQSGELRYQYDMRGNRTHRIYWDGGVTEYHYDEEGRLVSAVEPLGNKYTATYDINGRIKSFGFPNGESIFNWDAGGNLIEVRDRADRVTRYGYLIGGRIQKVTKPNGDTVQYFWGTELDQLLQIHNEKGEVYTYEFDTDCRLIKETGFDQRVHQYEYDAAGNLIAFINGLGRRITYTYDPASRIMDTVLSDGTTIKYEHGLWGLTKSTYGDCHLEFEYDIIGRLVKEKLNKHWIERAYNPLFKCTQLSTDLDDVIGYEYDASGYLATVFVNQAQALRSEYDLLGHEIRRIMPGGIDIVQEFDPLENLVSQVIRSTQGQNLNERIYEYNSLGDVVRITDSQWRESRFAYDPLQRLTSSLKERGFSEAFGYDPTSNLTATAGVLSNQQDWSRTEQQLSALPRTESRISTGDRFIQYGNILYEYDDEGCLIRKVEPSIDGSNAEWLFKWDDRSQLIGLTRPDGKKWSYFYDPLGRRYKKVGPDGTTEYIWNGNVVLYELAEGNKSLWLYEQERFHPIGVSRDNRIYYCINDPIGRPVELMDENGQKVWSASFKIWGLIDEIVVNEVNCPIRFQGQWFDEESGLHYNRFRYYDPQAGRFISPDPIKIHGSLNLYWYVNNPLGEVDPFGLDRPLGSQTPAFSGGHHTLPGAMFDSNHGTGVTSQSVAAYNQTGWRPSSGYEESHSAIHRELASQMSAQGLQTNNAPYPSREALTPMRNLPVDDRIQNLRNIYNSDDFLNNAFKGDATARQAFVDLFEQEAKRVQGALATTGC